MQSLVVTTKQVISPWITPPTSAIMDIVKKKEVKII